MSRVILRTIVSSPHEIDFVRLNWLELKDLVDVFLITEADVTHSGIARDAIFESYIPEEMKDCPKVKYVFCKIDKSKIKTEKTPENFHENEQLIRDCFRSSLKLEEDDIVISCDADEVLFKNRINMLIKKVRFGKPFAESYCLRLFQIIYRFTYFWKDCDFRGPTVSTARFFLKQDKPQWRYEGRFTLIKSGTHFSWVMGLEDMLKKIRNYAHSSEFEHLANLNSLNAMVQDLTYPFEPQRNFTIVKQKNLRTRIYPKSLAKTEESISQELIR
jgi:hypothetical protein